MELKFLKIPPKYVYNPDILFQIRRKIIWTRRSVPMYHCGGMIRYWKQITRCILFIKTTLIYIHVGVWRATARVFARFSFSMHFTPWKRISK